MHSAFNAVTRCSILPSQRRMLRVFQVPVTQLSFGVTQPFDVWLTREQTELKLGGHTIRKDTCHFINRVPRCCI